MNCVSQKKDVIDYPRFTKLIIADLMKKFPSIPPRLKEDYHSIKDDIPLVSVYTTGNVTVRGMLIPDAFLTKEVRATDDYKEYETVFVNVVVPMNQPQPVVSTQRTHRSTPRAHSTPTLTTASPQRKKRKKSIGETSSPQKSLKVTINGRRIEPGSHKEHPEVVDDDDDNQEEKKDEKKDDEMGNQANDPALWDVLKLKFEKSSTSNTSCRNDEFYSQQHDDHQEDDASLEGEKRVKRHKTSKSSKNGMHEKRKQLLMKMRTSNKLYGESDSLGKQTRDIRRPIPKPFVFYEPQRNPNEPPRITEVVRITTDQLYGLDFMEQIIVMRENDKPDSFSEADFKYLNKNDIEDLYYLCRNKKGSTYLNQVDKFINNVHQKSCDLGESL
ncbi:hypothetical protein Tco_1071001 [Tanacetum coccineum]|uniref:Uncharacterized protein n=1 Tax=Tanacetum coccineum TaxID=301880 RepID=A0ABQ5HP49_9ASTR